MSPSDDHLTSLQKLFLASWKLVLGAFAFLNGLGALLIARAVWEEMPFYAGVLIVLLAVALAYVEVELISRLWIGPAGATFDWREGRTKLIVGGYALAAALAVFLLYIELGGRANARQQERAAAEERAARQRALDTPEARAAEEFIQRRNAATPPPNR